MTIALVTGTSSGIGLATAVTLARGGHTVIATMRNLESAGELQKIVAAEKLPVAWRRSTWMMTLRSKVRWARSSRSTVASTSW